MRWAIVLLVLSLSCSSLAQTAKQEEMEIEAEGSYLMPEDGNASLAKRIALFEAKKNAVESAGRYLLGKLFPDGYELRKEELYSLAADEVAARTIAENWQPSNDRHKYSLRIRAKVTIAEILGAESLSKEMESEWAKSSLREEMEPVISNKIVPGRDIARAYMLLRKKKWRMALIYLDRLEKKYPNWEEIYVAKAITYYSLNNPSRMKKSLKKACILGSAKACHDLRSLKRVHKVDLDDVVP